MTHDVILYGSNECHKVNFYQRELKKRGVAFHFRDVDGDVEARRQLTELTGSADHFPTLLILGKKLRNPSLKDLDKALARAKIYDPGLIHDEVSGRFVRYMAPRDAFVSYTWRGETMVLGHIEIDPSFRGSGLGARFAAEVFETVISGPHPVRLTCPFLRKVAATQKTWSDAFLGR